MRTSWSRAGCGVLVDRLGACGDSPAQAPGTLRDHVREEASCVAASGSDADRSFEERLPLREQPSIAVAVQRFDEPPGAPAAAPGPGRPSAPPCRRQERLVGCSLSARTSTSMSRGGPVRRPIHENSVEKCSTTSGGNTCLIWPSSERVRRTATRKSWRNSVSRLARRPGSLATRMPSSARWICRAPTSARIVGARSTRGDEGRLVPVRQPGEASRRARPSGQDSMPGDSRSPARVARRRLRSRAGPSA